MKLYEGFSTGLFVIRQEKMRSVLTMLGIIIGVAAVLAMLAIGEGAKRIVMQEFEKFGGHFMVRRNPVGKEIKLSMQGGRPDRFLILGVMGKRGTSLQYGFSWDDVVFVPLTTAQDRFKGKHYVNYINVRAIDADSVEKAAEEVRAVLRKRHRNQDNFFDISFATAAVQELDKISRIIKIMLSSIAAFSLFVGSVGIMNMMLVSVNQRTREIGIRRAIGAKRGDIFFQFLIEAVVMCGIGGFLGISLGIGIGYGCAYIAERIVKVIPHWPVVISLQWMAISVSISACIGIIFGLYPAVRASNISPIEALRTE